MAKLYIDHFFTLMANTDDDLKNKYIKNKYIKNQYKQDIDISKVKESCNLNIKCQQGKGTVGQLQNSQGNKESVNIEQHNQVDLRIKTFEYLLNSNEKLKITKLGKRMGKEMASLYLLKALNTIKGEEQCILKIEEYSQMSNGDAANLYNALQKKTINIKPKDINEIQNTLNTNAHPEISYQEIKKNDSSMKGNFAINNDVDDDLDINDYETVELKNNKNKKTDENQQPDNGMQIPKHRWLYNILRIEQYSATNKTPATNAIKTLIKGDKSLEKLYSDFTKGFAKTYQQKFKKIQDVNKQGKAIMTEGEIKPAGREPISIKTNFVDKNKENGKKKSFWGKES